MKRKNEKKSPLTAEEQDSPQPERLVTPQEEAGQDLKQLENPPQAEGPRGRNKE
jgi:hypothetical protein